MKKKPIMYDYNIVSAMEGKEQPVIRSETVRIVFANGLHVDIKPLINGEIEVNAVSRGESGEQIVARPVSSNLVRLAFVDARRDIR